VSLKKSWALTFLFLSFNFSWVPSVFSKSPESAHAEKNDSNLCQPSDCVPPGLNFRTRQTQRRLIEFEPYFGEYLGNIPSNSFVTGGRLAFRFAEAMSLGVEVNYSRLQFDPTSLLGLSVTTRNQIFSDVFFTYAFPVLQRSGKTVEEADLYTTLGLGDMHVNGKDRIMGMIGGGIKIFFKQKWLAIRFDVNTYMYSIPRIADSKFSDDWTFTLGPSFLFVPKKPKN
jgi:hypothetical protein